MLSLCVRLRRNVKELTCGHLGVEFIVCHPYASNCVEDRQPRIDMLKYCRLFPPEVPARCRIKRETLNITELQNCFLPFSHTDMRPALFSFVVAALCVQQAVSHPFDKRAIDGMYNILILLCLLD